MAGFVNGLVEVLVNSFDMYIIYRYMTIFFENRFANKKLAVVMYGVRFVLVFACGMVELLPIVSLLVYIGSIFYDILMLFFKNTKENNCNHFDNYV